MRSACEHRPDLAKAIFSNEIMNVPQSLCKDTESMFHGAKSETTKRLTDAVVDSIPKGVGKSAIIIETSPLIRAKSPSREISYFSDFVTYEIMKIGAEYHSNGKYSGQKSLFFPKLENPRILISSLFCGVSVPKLRKTVK